MKKIQYLFFMLMIVGLIAYCKGKKIDYRYVSQRNGLWLRAEPNVNSAKLILLPYGAVVKITTDEKMSGRKEAIGGVDGVWTDTEYNGKRGWAFDGIDKKNADYYLAFYDPIKRDKEASESKDKRKRADDFINRISSAYRFEYFGKEFAVGNFHSDYQVNAKKFDENEPCLQLGQTYAECFDYVYQGFDEKGFQGYFVRVDQGAKEGQSGKINFKSKITCYLTLPMSLVNDVDSGKYSPSNQGTYSINCDKRDLESLPGEDKVLMPH